jgi:hypothetical protein
MPGILQLRCECDVLSVLRSLGLMNVGGVNVIGDDGFYGFLRFILYVSLSKPLERTRRRIRLGVIIFGGSLA